MRWYLDLGIVGLRVVGKVWQTAPVGEIPKGGIRPPSAWCAVGMVAAWADTDLGQSHATRAEAMRVVADWWVDFSRTAPGPGPLPAPESVEGGK